ncbi:GNAT family N-acetyltransferase [Nocardioides sp. zg-1308]|nr:GNAT family N-acetyltransferase [Nocardioides sp. zg-1308]
MPATLELSDRSVTLRRATAGDLPAVVALLSDDPLGATRDGPTVDGGLTPYVTAFEAIDADPAQLLVVAAAEGRVVATMQLSFIPGLSRRGALRAQVEGVRVHADLRGSGLGRAMLTWAVDEARTRGCALVQLTSDKQRTRAHGFYEELGFVASPTASSCPSDRAGQPPLRGCASRCEVAPGARRADAPLPRASSSMGRAADF